MHWPKPRLLFFLVCLEENDDCAERSLPVIRPIVYPFSPFLFDHEVFGIKLHDVLVFEVNCMAHNIFVTWAYDGNEEVQENNEDQELVEDEDEPHNHYNESVAIFVLFITPILVTWRGDISNAVSKHLQTDYLKLGNSSVVFLVLKFDV